jgi:hypothetical protein
MIYKHYIENKRLNNTNHTKNWGLIHVLRKCKQFLLKINLFRHDIAEKMLSWRVATEPRVPSG